MTESCRRATVKRYVVTQTSKGNGKVIKLDRDALNVSLQLP